MKRPLLDSNRGWRICAPAALGPDREVRYSDICPEACRWADHGYRASQLSIVKRPVEIVFLEIQTIASRGDHRFLAGKALAVPIGDLSLASRIWSGFNGAWKKGRC